MFSNREERCFLQLRASVRVDFAVQANFFKSRCGPSHVFPQKNSRCACRHRTFISLVESWPKINTTRGEKIVQIPLPAAHLDCTN